MLKSLKILQSAIYTHWTKCDFKLLMCHERFVSALLIGVKGAIFKLEIKPNVLIDALPVRCLDK